MKIRFGKTTTTFIIVGTSLLITLVQACSGANTVTAPSITPVPGPTQVPVTNPSPAPGNLTSTRGTVTEIGFPLISVTTDQGQTIRFDISTYTQLLRADGSTGTTAELKVGARVEVQYDGSTKIARAIKIL